MNNKKVFYKLFFLLILVSFIISLVLAIVFLRDEGLNCNFIIFLFSAFILREAKNAYKPLNRKFRSPKAFFDYHGLNSWYEKINILLAIFIFLIALSVTIAGLNSALKG